MNCVKIECEYNRSNKTKLKLSIFNNCNLLSLFLSKLKALLSLTHDIQTVVVS